MSGHLIYGIFRILFFLINDRRKIAVCHIHLNTFLGETSYEKRQYVWKNDKYFYI